MPLCSRPADLDAVLEAARLQGPAPVVLACGHDPAALVALARAEACGLAEAVLVGQPELIEAALKAQEAPQRARIVEAPDEESAVRRAVDLVREGRGRILLKGKTQTATVMRAVLDRERGLRTGRLLSDAFIFEYAMPEGGTRLICVTDGGINVAPDLAAKKHILENAVEVYHSLGFERPRVAVMSAVESVIPDHVPSLDAVELTRMAAAGEIQGCVVEGPLSLDLAISPAAAGKKGHGGEVAGQADILLCPDIVSANLLAKGTTWFGHARLAHVIMGAAAPVLIPSRSDTPDAKLFSIALGVLALRKQS